MPEPGPEPPGTDPPSERARAGARGSSGADAAPVAPASTPASESAFEDSYSDLEPDVPEAPPAFDVTTTDAHLARGASSASHHTVRVPRTTPARAHGRSFREGQVVAQRFRIARFLGEGGMGEVYEAEDYELRERVALKTVRPETAAEPRALEAFRREVHLARKVTHPNVCRIFDVFHHADAETGADVTFVTMELLGGETLSQRLRGAGRMAPEAVLPLARQMAAALGAAHARGVVHRDFKGANVMLVPADDGSSELRAVVTDFGLARAEAGGDDSFGTLRTGDRIAGTPAYMAPEQLTGGPVTPALDVYALGIVLYEMLAGRPPFVADSPLATAVLRLKEAPSSPRTFVPELSRRWEAVILRCLEREPEARFASAAEVVAALEGSAPVGSGRPAWSQRPVRAALAVAVVLAVVAGGVWLARRGRTASATDAPAPAAAAPAATARPAVAVLGFRNLAGRGDAAWLSTAVAEMLASELAAGGRLRLLPGESVARAKLELSLGDAEALAADTLQRLRRNLGSDLVVTGSYLALGDKAGGRVRLDLRVQDARTGESLEPVVENGTEAELGDMLSRCGRRVRAALGVRDVQDGELAAARAAFSSNAAWARLYAEGIERLRHYDAPRARTLLERAVAADPQQPLAHSALAEAWDRLGYGEKARTEAKRALELSGGLAREERLLVEARSRGYGFDWAGAVENYRTLWGFSPDNVDYGLALANAFTSASRGREALALVESLRRLPAPARDDPRIDLAESRAADALSDSPRAAQLAERAAIKGTASGASLVVAEARLRHAWALFRMGEADQARTQASESHRLYAAAGDRSGAAAATMIAANVLWMQQGRHDEAAQLYAQALAAFRAAGSQREVTSALLNSAGSLAERGDLDGARRRCEEALPVFREISDVDGEASALTNVGSLYLQLGQPAQAQRRQLEAAALFRRIGSRSGEAHALKGLAAAERDRGDLTAARRSHEQALALLQASSEKASAAFSRAQLAGLLVNEGRHAEAEAAARAAADELHATGHSEEEALALDVLARALLGQGRVPDARAAAQLAESRAAQQSRGTRLQLALTAARAQAAAGERAAAVRRLRETLAEAHGSGRVDLEFEARLALGELGEGGLEALARDARERGFGLIARLAEAATRRTVAR